MSALTTTWRYLKGVLSGVAVLFGMVGIILLVEIYEGIPDNVAFLVAIVGIATAGYAMYRASRPAKPQETPLQREVDI